MPSIQIRLSFLLLLLRISAFATPVSIREAPFSLEDSGGTSNQASKGAAYRDLEERQLHATIDIGQVKSFGNGVPGGSVVSSSGNIPPSNVNAHDMIEKVSPSEVDLDLGNNDGQGLATPGAAPATLSRPSSDTHVGTNSGVASVDERLGGGNADTPDSIPPQPANLNPAGKGSDGKGANGSHDGQSGSSNGGRGRHGSQLPNNSPSPKPNGHDGNAASQDSNTSQSGKPSSPPPPPANTNNSGDVGNTNDPSEGSTTSQDGSNNALGETTDSSDSILDYHVAAELQRVPGFVASGSVHQ